MRTCPSCGEVYDEDVLVCAHDGAALDDWAHDTAVGEEDDAYADTAEVVVRAGPDSPTRIRLEALLDESPAAASGVRTAPVLRARPLPAEPVPGQLVGERYLLGARLAVGGFGAVFAAEDRRLHKRVAVKVLSPRIGADEEMLQRFRREAIAASQIGHPGIIDVTDQGGDAGGLNYIVMEFLDGHDLAEEIRDHAPFPLVRALVLARDIAETLAVAHQRGVVHRDLKPANVFLIHPRSAGERVKIIDFGISKMLEVPEGVTPLRLTSTGQVMGTPHYLAPEQALVGRSVDARADVYALGVILYEMLVGRPPFTGASLSIVASHLSQPVVPPSQAHPGLRLDDAVDRLVLRALAKEPDDRHASMLELAAELRQLELAVTGAPVLPRTMPVLEARPALPVSALPAAPRLTRASVPPTTTPVVADRKLLVVLGLAVVSLVALLVILLSD